MKAYIELQLLDADSCPLVHTLVSTLWQRKSTKENLLVDTILNL